MHRAVKGTNVTIAVIDSEIDVKHPDLAGVIADRFDAVGTPEKPHPHGTGMAGAIGSHTALIGIAPGARLLAVHAFCDQRGDRREHHVQHPQGPRLGGQQGRAHHQHELCRPAAIRSLERAHQGRARQGHRADRGRRQCRAEVAAALSGAPIPT